jgi:hypothetical protein
MSFHNRSEQRIAFRVPVTLAAELRAIAERENNGISAIVRRLLTAAIARERQQTDLR